MIREGIFQDRRRFVQIKLQIGEDIRRLEEIFGDRRRYPKNVGGGDEKKVT